LRQWKQAVKVFESATTDVIGEKAPKLWVEYGRFCRERGKFANAQKVYLRAVEVLASKAERDVIWAEFLEALKAKGGAGTEGIETVAQLKAMLNVPEEEEEEEGEKEEVEEEKEEKEEEEKEEKEEEAAAAAAAEEEAAAAPVDDAVARVLAVAAAAAAGGEAVFSPIPEDHQPQYEPMDDDSVAAAAAATAFPPPSLPPTQLPPPPPQQPLDLEPPPLLFTTEALLTMEDAYGSGLNESTLEAVKALLADPSILDIVEGQWLIQTMKQQLATTIVARLDAKHAEASQRLAIRHVQAQQQLASLHSLPPSFHQQLEQERQALALACERERTQLGAQLSIEFWQLLEAQQAVLGEGEGGAGLPEVRVTRDRAAVLTQQQVLRVVTANMQLYHFHQKRQKLTDEVAKHAEFARQLQGPPPATATAAGDSASSLVLPPPTTIALPSPSSPSSSSSSPISSSTRGGGKSSSKRGQGSRWKTIVPLAPEGKPGKGEKSNRGGGEESGGGGGGEGGGGGGRGSGQIKAKVERRGNTRERGAAAVSAAVSSGARSPPRRSSRRNGGGEKGERGKGGGRDGGRESEEPNPPPCEDNRAILRKMMQHFK